MPGLAPGILLLKGACCKNLDRAKKNTFYKYYVLLFTFLIYTMYHMSRKPLSVVKSQLVRNCTGLNSSVHHNSEYWCSWAPFNTSESSKYLGALDSAFLFSYAICMFFSGYLAERSNLRYYLTGGMLLSSLSVFLFGLGYWTNMHSMAYYVSMMVFGGIVQTSGWPAVVNCVGNWFGKKKRGFIFGIWNSHTSFGNILGAYLAGLFVEYNWGFSFAVPAFVMGGVAILVFFFLIPYPEDVDFESPNQSPNRSIVEANQNETRLDSSDSVDESSPMVNNSQSKLLGSSSSSGKAISILGAVKIPGVVEFSVCLFFAKLVGYTLLYWLPRYINVTDKYSPTISGNLATAFDFGGILGGITAGLISDLTGASATTCILSLLLSTPMLYGYKYFVNFSLTAKFCYLFGTGIFVNGPYALITTAVATELGTSSALQGNSKALSTVTAIIDGTGSFGAAIGPLLTGFLSSSSWENVFWMLIGSALLAALVVVRISIKEILRLTAHYEMKCCSRICKFRRTIQLQGN